MGQYQDKITNVSQQFISSTILNISKKNLHNWLVWQKYPITEQFRSIINNYVLVMTLVSTKDFNSHCPGFFSADFWQTIEVVSLVFFLSAVRLVCFLCEKWKHKANPVSKHSSPACYQPQIIILLGYGKNDAQFTRQMHWWLHPSWHGVFETNHITSAIYAKCLNQNWPFFFCK